MTNLILDQGADWVRTWTYKDSGGTPINLTGCAAAFQARFGDTEGSPAADLDSAAKGGVVLGGALGTITVTIPNAASSALGPLASKPQGGASEVQGDGSLRAAQGAYCVWGLELTDAMGKILRLDGGVLVITREVVR